MRKMVLTVATGCLVLLMTATNSWALITPNPTPWSDEESLYQVINHVYEGLGLSSPGFTANSQANSWQITPDAYWKNLATNQQDNPQYAVIGIFAGNTNTPGFYPMGSPALIQWDTPGFSGKQYLGTGLSDNPYPGGVISNLPTEFGWGLQTEPKDSAIWYSDPSLNSDGLDHMLTYQLQNMNGQEIWVMDGQNKQKVTLTDDTYLLAWEDQSQGLSDLDYNDLTLVVSKVRPIPEPMSILLVGSGLLGLFGLRRKTS